MSRAAITVSPSTMLVGSRPRPRLPRVQLMASAFPRYRPRSLDEIDAIEQLGMDEICLLAKGP